MNWGFSLLGVFDAFAETWDGMLTFFSNTLYSLVNLIFGLLYKIWSGLAFIVDQVEGLFRNLAGVGGTDGGVDDMASLIINNKAVQTIFNNLVAISTALLIVLTIFKIIQEHYKEKEGGNPYIIVFRMFKGMLMFFFVTAAVMIGLYASGVVFRALDKATGNGSVSISGQIFQAMAYDANRMRIGPPSSSDAFARAKMDQYNKVVRNDYETAPESKSMKYTIAEVTGETATNAQVAAAYANLPINKWGIVSSDGTVSRINPLYEVEDDALKDTIYDKDFYKPGEADSNWGVTGGFAEGSYSNDLLQAVTINVSPKIDIEYSPLEIWETKWRLFAGQVVDTTINVMGSSVSAGYQKYEYRIESHNLQPVGEDNMFSININGGVSLQGGKAAANFSLDMFKTSMPVDKILATLVTNYALTELVEFGLSALPELPLVFNVGPLSIDLRYLAMLILTPLVNNMLMGQLAQKIGGDSQEAQDRIKEFIVMEQNPSIPIKLKKYRFDTNFMKIWEQITDSWDDFASQISQSADYDKEELNKGLTKVDTDTSEVKQQQNWAIYKGAVDSYNSSIQNTLSQFLTDTYDYANNLSGDKDAVGKRITNNLDSLIESYKNVESDLRKLKPKNYKAESYINSIYLPAFTTTLAKGNGTSLGADKIIDMMKQSGSSSITFNLTVPESSSGAGGYQVVDWSCYSDDIAATMKATRVADQYSVNGKAKDFMSSTLEIRSLTHFRNTGSGPYPYSGWIVRPGDFGKLSVVTGTETAETKMIAAQSIIPTTVETTKEVSNVRSSSASRLDFTAFTDSLNSLLYASKDNSVSTSSADTSSSADSLDREIVVFRDMSNPSAKGEEEKSDIKTLKSWLNTSSTVTFPNGNVNIFPVYAQSAETIDSLMSKNTSRTDARRYLMLADPFLGSVTEQTSQVEFESILSYSKYSAVNALYDMGSINYVIGYMGLVVVMGVYMNFTFGLIQRVVNLAVLYMLSPLTIAFYPFDDGQRFQSQFISPFYKQTISAFAIIISLNLFFVLISPIKNAVTAVAGDTLLMSTLALIAFVSMLPKIRDMVVSVLGADSIQEKKLLDVVKDAGKTLGTSNIAKLAKLNQQYKDKKASHSAVWRDKKEKMFKGIQDIAGKTPFVGKGVKDALEANKERKRIRQDNIEQARATGDKSSLTKAEQKIMNLQDRQADKALNKLSDEQKATMGIDTVKSLQVKAKAGDKEAANKLADLKRRSAAGKGSVESLLKEDQRDKINSNFLTEDMKTSQNKSGFFRGVDSVLSAKAKAKAGVATAGKGLVESLKYTPVGDVFETLFHPATGAIADTTLGKALKYIQPSERMKRIKEMNQKESDWRKARFDVDDSKEKQLTGASEALLQNEQEKEANIRAIAAASQASEGVSTMTEENYKMRYLAAAKDNYLKEGKTEIDANNLANEEWVKKPAEEKERLFKERGGLLKFADDLKNQSNGAEVDERFMTAARKELNEKIAVNDIESLYAGRKNESAEISQIVNGLMDNFQNKMGLKGNKRISSDFYKVITESIKNGEDMESIAKKISTKIPNGESQIGQIKTHMSAAGFGAELTTLKLNLDVNNRVIDSAISNIKKTQKAESWLKEDLNVDINSQEYKNYFKAYRALNDVNYEGGKLKLEEKLRIKYHGDINDPQYQRELNDLHHKFSKQYEFARDAVGKRQDVFKYDYSVRQIEREKAEFVNAIGKQYRKRIDYHTRVNMTTKAQNVMNTDKEVVSLKAKGDYTGAALKMDSAVNAALKKDWEALEATNLDPNTIKQFKVWGESGESGARELKSIKEYFDISRKFMGNAKGESGGNSVQSTRNQMAAIFQVVEKKQLLEFYQAQGKNVSSAEDSLRRKLTIREKELKTQFVDGSGLSKKLASELDIRDANGKIITDLGGYLSDIVHKVSFGEISDDDPQLKQLMKKIALLANDWGTRKDLIELMPANRGPAVLEAINSTIHEGASAKNYSDQYDTYTAKAAEIMTGIYLPHNQLNSGDDKKG